MRLEVVLSVIVVAVALAAAWWFRAPAEPSAPLQPTTTTRVERVETVVHVSGEVAEPGLVRLDEGSRVADAILAAGGTTRDADLTRVNLAAVVVDGQQITVPAVGERSAPVAGDGRIRINDASPAELEELPGVGPVLAQRIITHREAIGRFESVEDLLDVPGIGEATLANLRDLIVVP